MNEDTKKNTEKLKIKCEVYTRVCGFYRPVSQMNKGKQEEVKERLPYNLGFSNRRFL